MKKTFFRAITLLLSLAIVFSSFIMVSAESEYVNLIEGKTVFTTDYHYCGYGDETKPGSDIVVTSAPNLTDGIISTKWETNFGNTWMKDENNNATFSKPFAVIKLGENPVAAEYFSIVLTDNDSDWGPDYFRLYGTNDDSVLNVDWREQFTNTDKYTLVFDSKESNVGGWTDGSGRFHIGKGTHTYDFTSTFEYKYIILQINPYSGTSWACCSELEVYGELVAETYTVTYKSFDDTVLKVDTVLSGANSTPPAVIYRDGYKFTGWNGNYNNITESVVLTAQYEEADDTDFVSISDNKTVTTMDYHYCGYGDQSKPNSDTIIKTAPYLNDGSVDTKWEATFGNTWMKDENGEATFSKPFAIVKMGDEPVAAEYFSIILTNNDSDWGPDYFRLYGTNDDSVLNVDWREQFTNTEKYTLVFDSKESNVGGWTDGSNRFHIGKGAHTYYFANAFEYKYLVLQINPYSGTGYVTCNELSVYGEEVVENIVVTYKDYDGTVIKTETLLEGATTTPPAVFREGYDFVGWDNDYKNITESVVITAQYAEPGANGYVSVTDNKAVITKDYHYCGYGKETIDGSAVIVETATYLNDGDISTIWTNNFNNTWMKSKYTGEATNSRSFAVIKLGDEAVAAHKFSITFKNDWGPQSFAIFGTNNDDAISSLDWRDLFEENYFEKIYDSANDSSIGTWTCGSGDGHIGEGTYVRDLTQEFNYKYVILQIYSPYHAGTICNEFTLFQKADVTPSVSLMGASVVVMEDGYEYSIDGINWSTNRVIDDIGNGSYIYQRIAATETTSVSGTMFRFVTPDGIDDYSALSDGEKLVALRKVLLTNDNPYAADINKDLEINILDLVRLKKEIAGIQKKI